MARKRPIVPNNLANLRIYRGYSQKKMADLVGINPVTYRKYEAGRFPKYQVGKKIARVLEFSEEQIWGGDSDVS